MITLPGTLDYSKYVTLIRNQDGWKGCAGMSVLHAFDILLEMNECYSPDLSYAFNRYTHIESAGLEGARGDKRITEHGLNQFGVLQVYGCCPESSFHTNFDPTNTEQYPTDGNMEEAYGYRIASYTPFPGKKFPDLNEDLTELKQLLYEHGPLILLESSEDNVLTIIGYNDETRMIKCISSAPVSKGVRGIVEKDYKHIRDRFKNHDASVEWMEIKPSYKPVKYVARINVSQFTSRNNLTIKVGVEGLKPMVVWDRNCKVNMPDDTKELIIDVPLPDYAAKYWPPDEYKWLVEITDNSVGSSVVKSGIVNEITFVERNISNIKHVFGCKGGIMYAVTEQGDLVWSRHTGYDNGAKDWKSEYGRVVGKGWEKFTHIFGSNDGIIYAVDEKGNLFWHRHLGYRDGSDRWENNCEGIKVGYDWNYKQVFAGLYGVIYAVNESGDLFWYKHTGYKNGLDKWENHGSRRKISSGWQFNQICGGKDGIIYAVKENGDLYWFKHNGYADGSANFENEIGGTEVGRIVATHWSFKNVFGGRDGILYVVTKNGDPGWFKHTGFIDGTAKWENNGVMNKIRPAHGLMNRHVGLDLYTAELMDKSIYHGGTIRAIYFKPVVARELFHIPEVRKVKDLKTH